MAGLGMLDRLIIRPAQENIPIAYLTMPNRVLISESHFFPELRALETKDGFAISDRLFRLHRCFAAVPFADLKSRFPLH